MDALRLGTYQLVLMTQIPPHAALHQTVELAAAQGRPGAKGFLNGVLRRVAELLTPTPTWADGPAADAVPLEDGRQRRLNKAVFPEPTTEPAAYLAAAYAWPEWLTERWLARHGWDECLRLGSWFAGPAPLWLRVNPLRVERDAYLERLREAGVAAESGTHPQAIRLLEHATVRELPGYADGDFSVQDQAAMKVATALDPRPGMAVLDLCAAPGGKTTHLIELMANAGQVVACDIDEQRLRTVMTLAERLGLGGIATMKLSETVQPPARQYDAAVADVPCSNTGVLGRRPEVRWRLTPRELPFLTALQQRLLTTAIESVRSGGAVVYSTCSIEPEENGELVRQVIEQRNDVRLEAEEISIPGQPADGGYWARLRKAH
jgi:16S rRNA (cytosine967-C5)-methyltransferase